MTITKKFYVYILTDQRGNDDIKIVDEPSDNLCIGGYQADGTYCQYDSYEAYHVHSWAKEKGFTVRTEERSIQIDV
jgi:hypothetical protein